MLSIPIQAKLYQFQAKNQVAKNKAANKEQRLVCLIVIIFCLLLCFGTWKHEVTKLSKTDINWISQKIRNTNKKVYDNLYDINEDGEINCEDFSILFYKYYPYSNVRIFQNRSNVKNFYHAFNAIRINGIWKTVEPQAFPKSPFWMEDFWGKRYRPELDEDITNEYKDYYTKYAGNLTGRIPSRIANLVIIILIAVECYLILCSYHFLLI